MLLVLAAFFALSAAVRITVGAAPAIAREVAHRAESPDAGTGPAACDLPPNITAILADLATRERSVSDKEQDLKFFEQALKVAEEQVRINLAALESAEQELAATIALSEAASENDLVRLAAMIWQQTGHREPQD